MAGLNIREVHRETGIPEGTLRHWAAGDVVIPKKDRPLLARVIGCNIQDLAPIYEHAESSNTRMNRGQTFLPEERRDMAPSYFSFGKLQTTEVVLDGDGTGVYLPQHIRSHYIPVAEALPEELQARKAHIQQEQEVRRANGDPYQWNGERYSLSKFNISRDPMHEDMTLDLWFRPSDYYTFLATSMSLQEPEMRAKYLADVEWDEAVPLFSHSFGAYLTLVTADGYTILVQRGKRVGNRPNTFDISLAEGLSRPLDRGTNSQAPDIYRCALRGLSEELGLHEPVDFSLSDILFLSFAVDTQYCMWGLFGMVKLQRRADEVLQKIQRGVRDKFENRRLFAVPFTPQDVCSFVFSHEPFAPGGLVCLYHALVHEFGREKVDTTCSIS
jgi:hypothetical protein